MLTIILIILLLFVLFGAVGPYQGRLGVPPNILWVLVVILLVLVVVSGAGRL